MNQALIHAPGTGLDYLVWGDRYSFKTTAAQSDGKHTVFEMTVNPGSGTPPHIHHGEDEMFCVLEGELSLWCGDQKVNGTPGSFVAVPRGTVHRWANESGSPARVMVILVPGGFDEFLMKIGTPVTEENQTSAPPSKEDIDYALSIAGDYHMEVVSG